EIDIIAPAVAELKSAIGKMPVRLGPKAEIDGPLPPDTLFHHLALERWDAALSMYHDQGLIPLKLHAFHEGVNVTIGLPFFRTSPDHGTAFAIAGAGIARPDSMIAAIKLSVELATAEK